MIKKRSAIREYVAQRKKETEVIFEDEELNRELQDIEKRDDAKLKKKRIRFKLKFQRRNILFRCRVVNFIVNEHLKLVYLMLETGELKVCRFPTFEQLAVTRTPFADTSSQAIFMRLHEELLFISNQRMVFVFDLLLEKHVRTLCFHTDVLKSLGDKEVQVIPVSFCRCVYLLLCQSSGSIFLAEFPAGALPSSQNRAAWSRL